MSKQIQCLTINEEELLLGTISEGAIGTPAVKRQCRDTLIFLLMLDAGLRVQEVARLTRGCLVFANHFCDAVVIPAAISKNHRERTVPVTARLKLAIQDMSEQIWLPLQTRSEQYAFFTNNPDKHMTRRAIQYMIGFAGQTAFGKKIHPHQLRHTFATKLMKFVNIRIVQELLGHVSIASTQVYTHPNNIDLKDAIQKLSETC